MADILIHTDGAARGNPGPAGFGAVIEQKGAKSAEISGYLGTQTNNWAEYEGLIRGLQKAYEVAEEKKGLTAEARLDSELIVKQLNGEYKVKDSALKEQYARVQEFLKTSKWDTMFVHVPRAENAEADALANEALDNAVL